MPDAPKTKRQKIVEAMLARFAEISTDNDYQTDIGANVKDWQVHWNDEDLPGLSVCDLVSEVQKEFSDQTQTVQTMTVSIRLFTAASVLAPALRILIGDVNAAIKQDPRWKVDGVGLAIDTRPRFERLIVPTPGNEEVAGAEVVVEVEFITGTFNAYQ